MKIFSSRVLLVVTLIIVSIVLSVCVSATELNIGIPVEEYPDLFINRTMPTHGNGKITVFLIQFPDYLNDNPDATQEHYNQLYFSPDKFDDKVIGDRWNLSVSTFYKEQSFGKLNLSGQVFDWYTTKHERSYYNDFDKKAELVMEVISYYESQGVNFDQFDGDGNGELDAVIYHFAGEADLEQEGPWYGGTEYAMAVGTTKSGKEINSFIQISNGVDVSNHSLQLLRVICHELMHTLGMYDLYGKAWFALQPVDDLMSVNTPMINPFYKMLLGWTNKVTLVTSDALDIKLNNWESYGETILVTDNYNGIFDEYYVIAHSKYNEYAVNEVKIWHVDARLNEDKTAFLCDNLTYSPKPSDGDQHGEEKEFSPYLFVEEVSAIPEYDMVLNLANNLYFREGSTLGVNAIPSSDTHDGRYTGITITDFKTTDTYATMDITFAKSDAKSPEVSLSLSVIGASKENKLRFNEYIYPSDNWDSICITTLDGEIIPAQFSRSYYSVHEIEIIIEGEIPLEGYIIVIPEGSVRDSYGNNNKAQTVPVVFESKIREQSRTHIPWYYENQTRRWEDKAFFFTDGDESIIITGTGEEKNVKCFIEFIKLDADGNIIAHKFIYSPYPDMRWNEVIQTNDGSYIIPIQDYSGAKGDALICIDKDGNLRWYKRSEITLSETVTAYKDGVIFFDNGARLTRKAIYVDARDGSFTLVDTNEYAPNFSDVCFDGSNFIGVEWIRSSKRLCVYVRSQGTYNITKTVRVDSGEFSECIAPTIAYNSDGTYVLAVETTNAKTGRHEIVVFKLDSSLNVIKKVTIDATLVDGATSTVTMYKNDGLSILTSVVSGNHSNSNYRVFRMDKNLNVIWECDIETSYATFFVTPTNKVFAFATFWSPERNAYLLNYGSEEQYELISHNMIYQAARAATCTQEGQTEFWKCTDCGGCFADDGGKKEISYADVVIPKTPHIPETYADVEPTCTENGSTGGTYCVVCSLEMSPKTAIEATGHTEEKEDDVAPTCTDGGYIGKTYCTVCEEELTPREVIKATGHTVVVDDAVEPTYESTGLTEGSHCSVCGEIIVEQKLVDKLMKEDTAPAETDKPVDETPVDNGVSSEPDTTASTSVIIAVAIIVLVGAAVVAAIVIKKRK